MVSVGLAGGRPKKPAEDAIKEWVGRGDSLKVLFA